jgi:hypothetical protein
MIIKKIKMKIVQLRNSFIWEIKNNILIRRYNRWKNWSKYTNMNKSDRVLVLLNLKKGPGFETGWLDFSVWDYN